MANQKISQLTEQTDLSLIDGLAGYEGTSNVRISGPNIISAIPTIYTSDGTLSGPRTISMNNNNITFSYGTGNQYPAINSNKFVLYPNGKDSLTASEVITVTGKVVFPYLGHQGQGLVWNSYNTSSTGYGFTFYGGGGFSHNNGNCVIGPNFTFNSGDALSSRLGIIGKTSTSTSGYAFRVQDSASADMFSLRDDGAFALGKGTTNSSSSNVAIGDGVTTSSVYGVGIGRLVSIGAAASYSTVIGNQSSTSSAQNVVVGAYSTAGFKGATLGYHAGGTGNYSVNIGTDAEGSAPRSITINASSGSATPSTEFEFGVYMTGSTPDFKVIGNEGMIPPNITTVTRDAIASPTLGSTIYNTTDNQLQYYNGDWRSIGVTPNSQLLAMTEITASATGNVTHDIHNYLNTPADTLTAVNFDSDGTNRYAKISFTPTYTGKAKIVFTSYAYITGGTFRISIGLHDRATSTTTPVHGWFMLNEDEEPGAYRIIRAEWIVDVFQDEGFAGYVQAIASGSSAQFIASNYQGAAWSNSNHYACPALVEAYSIENILITTNPTG